VLELGVGAEGKGGEEVLGVGNVGGLTGGMEGVA